MGTRVSGAVLALLLLAGVGVAGKKGWLTEEPAQLAGDTAATDEGWSVRALLTIGEQDDDGNDVNFEKLGYRPVGILDGIGAWKWKGDVVRVLVTHELTAGAGYAYELANGTKLTGARVSYFDIDRKSREICAAGPAYDRVFDRAGKVVTSGTQINEGASSTQGFDRFCSAHGFEKGEKGFRDDVFFCGEETGNGQECVIDVAKKDLYVAPMLGRAAWENLCAVENFGSDKIVLLVGDDTTGAPLWLYVGEKGAAPASGYEPPAFLKRNGLGMGYLYAWVSDAGDEDPSDFNGTGSSRKGRFERITHYDPSKAGASGWDALGFASYSTQDDAASALGAFRFSRPEDVSANPRDGTEIVLASTGNSGFAGGADAWGTTYIVAFDEKDLEKQLDRKLCSIDGIEATIRIVYDGDDAGDGQFSDPDEGLRSPDNLDWADDGRIYIQEDRSVGGFGAVSGVEASVWSLAPATGKLTRILEIDRSAVPDGQTDPNPSDLGNWESSGVLDVTKLFKTKKGETLLVLNTQAHNLQGGGLAGNSSQATDLVQGGQLLLASKIECRKSNGHGHGHDRDDDGDDD